jgi:hypothetical protein
VIYYVVYDGVVFKSQFIGVWFRTLKLRSEGV